jgi:hypothetical protein
MIVEAVFLRTRIIFWNGLISGNDKETKEQLRMLDRQAGCIFRRFPMPLYWHDRSGKANGDVLLPTTI